MSVEMEQRLAAKDEEIRARKAAEEQARASEPSEGLRCDCEPTRLCFCAGACPIGARTRPRGGGRCAVVPSDSRAV